MHASAMRFAILGFALLQTASAVNSIGGASVASHVSAMNKLRIDMDTLAKALEREFASSLGKQEAPIFIVKARDRLQEEADMLQDDDALASMLLRNFALHAPPAVFRVVPQHPTDTVPRYEAQHSPIQITEKPKVQIYLSPVTQAERAAVSPRTFDDFQYASPSDGNLKVFVDDAANDMAMHMRDMHDNFGPSALDGMLQSLFGMETRRGIEAAPATRRTSAENTAYTTTETSTSDGKEVRSTKECKNGHCKVTTVTTVVEYLSDEPEETTVVWPIKSSVRSNPEEKKTPETKPPEQIFEPEMEHAAVSSPHTIKLDKSDFLEFTKHHNTTGLMNTVSDIQDMMSDIGGMASSIDHDLQELSELRKLQSVLTSNASDIDRQRHLADRVAELESALPELESDLPDDETPQSFAEMMMDIAKLGLEGTNSEATSGLSDIAKLGNSDFKEVPKPRSSDFWEKPKHEPEMRVGRFVLAPDNSGQWMVRRHAEDTDLANDDDDDDDAGPWFFNSEGDFGLDDDDDLFLGISSDDLV